MAASIRAPTEPMSGRDALAVPTAGTGGVEELQDAFSPLPALTEETAKEVAAAEMATPQDVRDAVVEIGQLYTSLSKQLRLLEERFEEHERKFDQAISNTVDMVTHTRHQEGELRLQVNKLIEVFQSRKADLLLEATSTSRSPRPDSKPRSNSGLGNLRLDELASSGCACISGTVTSGCSLYSPTSVPGSSRLASTTLPALAHVDEEKGQAAAVAAAPQEQVATGSQAQSREEPKADAMSIGQRLRVLSWQTGSAREQHRTDRAEQDTRPLPLGQEAAAAPGCPPAGVPAANGAASPSLGPRQTPPFAAPLSQLLPGSRPITPTARKGVFLPRASLSPVRKPSEQEQAEQQQRLVRSPQSRSSSSPRPLGPLAASQPAPSATQKHPPVVKHTSSVSPMSRKHPQQQLQVQQAGPSGMEVMTAALRTGVSPRSVPAVVGDVRINWNARCNTSRSSRNGGSVKMEVSSPCSRANSPILAPRCRALTPTPTGQLHSSSFVEAQAHLIRDASDPALGCSQMLRSVGTSSSPVLTGRDVLKAGISSSPLLSGRDGISSSPLLSGRDTSTADGITLVGSPLASFPCSPGQLTQKRTIHASPSPPRFSPLATPRHAIHATVLRGRLSLPQPETVASLQDLLHPRC